MSRELSVGAIAIVMAAVTLLSPLTYVYNGVSGNEFYQFVAILWTCNWYSTGGIFTLNEGFILLLALFIVGPPNIVFAVFAVRFVAGKTTKMKVVLSGIVSALWGAILWFVTYLPYILTSPSGQYYGSFPMPVPVQLTIGLAIAWLHRPKVDDSVWLDEAKQQAPEPKKANWLSVQDA